jgi:hypothetical protein
MRFGVRLPGAGPLATPENIAAFARKAEDVGFTSLWMPNHIALPVQVETRYPYREDGKFFWPPEAPYLDTIVALTWASAATKHIEVGPSALVTAWHPPVNMAKELATPGCAERRSNRPGGRRRLDEGAVRHPGRSVQGPRGALYRVRASAETPVDR